MSTTVAPIPDWRAQAANQTRLAYGQALLEVAARSQRERTPRGCTDQLRRRCRLVTMQDTPFIPQIVQVERPGRPLRCHRKYHSITGEATFSVAPMRR